MFLNVILRLNIFICSYLLYLIQLLLIFFNFKNFAKQVVAMVISTFMKLLVIQPIVDAILGAFNLSGTKGSAITVPGTDATGDAGGGTMQANRPRLVGERGPELFIPNL